MPAVDVVTGERHRPHRGPAVAAVGLLLAQSLAICALALAYVAADPAHVLATAAPATVELAPDHAHADAGSAHVPHEQHATYSIPRTDNPLRLLMTSVAVSIVAATAAAWVSTPIRAPPVVAVPARCGRRVLLRLCVDRC